MEEFRRGDFWDAGNVQFLDLGAGSVHVCEKSSGCTLMIHTFFCMYIYSSKDKNICVSDREK